MITVDHRAAVLANLQALRQAVTWLAEAIVGDTRTRPAARTAAAAQLLGRTFAAERAERAVHVA
ncbi:MAG TPA: hypothetical protein VF163_05440, partial [Micromonosporaceae bacterium]